MKLTSIFICTLAFASVLSLSQANERGLTDILNEAMGEVKEALAIFPDVFGLIKEGKKPAEIAKHVIHKYPFMLKNLNAYTFVCKLPSVKNLDYVGGVCTFLDTYATKIIALLDENKWATGALVDKLDQVLQSKGKTRGADASRNFITDVLGDVFNEYKKSLSIFSEVASMMKNGTQPAQIIKSLIHKYPFLLKNTNIWTAACRVPALQKVEYVGPACTFIDTYADKVIALIDQNKEITGALIDKIDQAVQKPKTRSGSDDGRGVISDVFGDVFNYYKRQLGVFSEVAGMMKDGARPAQILKHIIHTYPDTLKNTNAFTGICKIPTLQKIDYVGPVCTWIDSNANKIIAIVDGNKELTGSLIDRVDQIYGR